MLIVDGLKIAAPCNRRFWRLQGAAHIFFLIGFRSRVMVMLSWLWSYFETDYGARPITRNDRQP